MNTYPLFIRLMFALTLALLSFGASAQQWYHVELLVFERFSGADAEHWPVMSNIRSGSLNPQMANNYIQPASTETLAGVAQRLRGSANYRVHYHKAWQQPVLSKSSAKGIQIKSDNNLVEGQLKLYKVTYLHADIDLWFKENGSRISSWSDTSNQGVDLSGPNNPHLQQIRRIRSKELIYFDHPRIAAIMELTPVATPAAAVSKTPESYSLPAASSLTETE
ncbi:CsiV family protein [Methylophaga sp. OBS4]|uniref:CsiV family protein n=1 Tax=Methylophaga sp. OBS4 TaxID=2991935 RepID=UPI00224D9EF8|nr:CsiV family protein [Methylophaga sp. OBS4]MCX4188201.1 peptidoglycan binding protein CsiV [Methylophaga sp. OBS4]